MSDWNHTCQCGEKDTLGLRPVRYYQLLNRIIDDPAALAQSATWWFWYRARAERVGRITIEGTHFLGDTVTVDCQTADEAAWLADQMRNVGIPDAAIKVLGAR